MLKYIFSLLLVLLVSFTRAQEVPENLLLLEDQGPKWGLRSIQFNYNTFRFMESVLNKPRNSKELQAELGFHKYFLVLDMGTSHTQRGRDYSYESEGSFWRTGVDVNMAKGWNEGVMIGLGLRYAKARFDEKLDFTKVLSSGDVEIFSQNIAYANRELSARWAELVFKMRTPIWKDLYTGYTMRYQFFGFVEGADSDLQTFDIPGYGKTTRPNSFGFDYYLGWRINFK